MFITLIRTGGIIPVTKKAGQEVDWTEEEMKELLKRIKNEQDEPGEKRDAAGYHLKTNAGTFFIDLEKVPAKYKSTFDGLKDNLAIVKSGS